MDFVYTVNLAFCETLTISCGHSSTQKHKKLTGYNYKMENLICCLFFNTQGRKVKSPLI